MDILNQLIPISLIGQLRELALPQLIPVFVIGQLSVWELHQLIALMALIFFILDDFIAA